MKKEVVDDKGEAAPQEGLEEAQQAKPVEKGTGTFLFPDGSRYEGDFILDNDVRHMHGTGKYTNSSEEYEGEWANDTMEGQGKITFRSGATYEGGFAANYFEGQGTYSWPDGATHVGAWRENKMHGPGTYIDKEGAKWEGDFCNGRFDNGKARVILRST